VEIGVGGDPLAAGFDGQGGQVGIRNQVAPGLGFPAEAGEDPPVTAARRKKDTVRLTPEALNESKSLLEWRRWVEDPRMGNDSQKPTQDQVR